MKKPAIKAGDIVHCQFLDHAENSDEAMLFEVFGRVERVTRNSYVIYCWRYVDAVDRAADSNS